MKQSYVLPSVVAIVLVIGGLIATLVVRKFEFETTVGAGIGVAIVVALAAVVIAAH